MHNQPQAPGHDTLAGATSALFTCLVRCVSCKSSRPMVIKALHPGVVSDNDRITYRCTACGAEKTEHTK